MKTQATLLPEPRIRKQATAKSVPYSIEYFHIYTDEKINGVHKKSLDYLKQAQKAWDFDHELVVLIDNYNPTKHVLNETDVFSYLEKHNLSPTQWAFEADMIKNADELLSRITYPKLKKQYLKYIESRGKYPCSLLTGAWYLTRLGELDTTVIRSTSQSKIKPAERLINILPEGYKDVERRAQDVILSSDFYKCADKIQNLYYPASAYAKVELF